MRIRINPKASEPLYIQIYDSVVAAIAEGEIQAGEQLPSSRRLAMDLQINYITVNKAYALLESEGFVVTNKKRVEVLDPTDEVRKDFLLRWKNTETLMITEARAKKVSKAELLDMFESIKKSL